MSKTPATNPAVARKSITLPTSLWHAVDDYRFSERIGSQAEAVRRLLQDGLAPNNERDRIVRWLRERAGECPMYEDWAAYILDAADAIERGGHDGRQTGKEAET